MRKTVALLFVVIVSTMGCATKVPEDAKPDLIVVSPVDGSPFWNSLVRRYFREVINEEAHYAIVTAGNTAPNTLLVNVFNQDRHMTGRVDKFVGVQFRVRVEAKATLIDSNRRALWEWEGYEEGKSESKAIVELAERVAAELNKAGFLKPGALPDESMGR